VRSGLPERDPDIQHRSHDARVRKVDVERSKVVDL
jgi:hypothetical protein